VLRPDHKYRRLPVAEREFLCGQTCAGEALARRHDGGVRRVEAIADRVTYTPWFSGQAAGAPAPVRPSGFPFPTLKRPHITSWVARRQRPASKNPAGTGPGHFRPAMERDINAGIRPEPAFAAPRKMLLVRPIRIRLN